MGVFGKVVLSIFAVGMLMLIIVGASQSLFDNTRTFSGQEKFANYDEAKLFQDNLVNEATKANAKILSADLSIQSPPKIPYSVLVPSTKWHIFSGGYSISPPQKSTFAFGEVGGSEVGAWVFISILMTFTLCVSWFCLWCIWSKEKQVRV